MALNEDREVIGYKFVHIGKMMDAIRHGTDPVEALKKNTSTYGRYNDAVAYIDPREE
jgi:hypothetical protein